MLTRVTSGVKTVLLRANLTDIHHSNHKPLVFLRHPLGMDSHSTAVGLEP